MTEYLLSTENPYILKDENMTIEITYSKNSKRFNEAILNILRLKHNIL